MQTEVTRCLGKFACFADTNIELGHILELRGGIETFPNLEDDQNENMNRQTISRFLTFSRKDPIGPPVVLKSIDDDHQKRQPFDKAGNKEHR